MNFMTCTVLFSGFMKTVWTVSGFLTDTYHASENITYLEAALAT